jgi:hypothetical protein
MGKQALTRAGRSSIATRLSVDAAWTRELHQDRILDYEEDDVGHVDELFVGEYEPVRYAQQQIGAVSRGRRQWELNACELAAGRFHAAAVIQCGNPSH